MAAEASVVAGEAGESCLSNRALATAAASAGHRSVGAWVPAAGPVWLWVGEGAAPALGTRPARAAR